MSTKQNCLKILQSSIEIIFFFLSSELLCPYLMIDVMKNNNIYMKD